ncbi:AAA family ATPase [Priestia megaterium]|uniref:ATPase AAA-type core domain-containing protein n=1 Tax=Priestia megaterium TaxID=1404 RepID=A0A6M6E3B6_PRIMG|nr:hypothetical protein [Priestia megaterium]QJX80134.1 hypothetical protein FDZ14_28990 [Priestia megaterium]
MEICYYWTESLGYTVENEGYNFGGELKFTYNCVNSSLKVEENDLYIKNFFNVYSDEKISNITAVVGRNGVGKSTFLEEIKNLYTLGGILAKKDKNGEVYDHRRIYVIKNEGKYEIVYHKDLLLRKKDSQSDVTNSIGNTFNMKKPTNFVEANVIFTDSKLEEKYLFVDGVYGNKNNSREADLFLIKKHYHLTETSCIYFSYAFDNNFYGLSTSINSKYFDLSTKGILNEIDYKLNNKSETLDTYDPTKPNHLNARDNRFNIGLLREYSVGENKKRIHLLNSKKGREFIKEHNFFPTTAYLNLDYILQGYDSLWTTKKTKSFLRSEKRDEVSLIESRIYDFIEEMYTSEVEDNDLLLARQTYLRRILDSYFEDVNHFINYDRAREYLMEQLAELDLKELNNKKTLFALMDYFNRMAIRILKEFAETNIDALSDFDAKEFSNMTKSYKEFISFFHNTFLSGSPEISIKRAATYLNTSASLDGDYELEGFSSKAVGLVEVNLTPKGICLLGEFLDQYDLIETGSDFIKIDWAGLSTGEDALLGMYSRFFALGKEFREESAKEIKDIRYDGKNLIILLDEVEHSLHPEWQRRIINDLIEFLPLAFTTAESIQVVIATNVPFIIADIPTNNVIYLEKDKGKVQIVNKPSQTFTANIHSLLMSNFFMDATIGRFSEQKIKDIVQHLKPNSNEDENNTSSKGSKQYSQEEIEKTIKVIGEPILRTKLKSLYDEKYPKDNKDSVAEQFMAEIESDTNIPDKIKGRLKDMYRELGKDQKDD